MEFHIASLGITPQVEAWFPATRQYSDNPVRFVATVPLLAGSRLHFASPVHETDRELKGSGTIPVSFAEAVQAVRDATAVLWEFSDGARAYWVRIQDWSLTPLGGGHATLTFTLLVVRRLV